MTQLQVPTPFLRPPPIPRTAYALSFNGTSQYAASQYILSLGNYNRISVGFWLNWTTFANNDKLAMEYSANYNNGRGFIFDPNSSGPDAGKFDVGINFSNSIGAETVAGFTRPTAGVWHHIMAMFDGRVAGAGQIPAIYVDGISQSLTYGLTLGTAASFFNQTLYLMSRAGTSLFGAGAMSNLTIYREILEPVEVLALVQGADPRLVGNGTLTHFWTLSVLHPEASLAWNAHTAPMAPATTAAVAGPRRIVNQNIYNPRQIMTEIVGSTPTIFAPRQLRLQSDYSDTDDSEISSLRIFRSRFGIFPGTVAQVPFPFYPRRFVHDPDDEGGGLFRSLSQLSSRRSGTAIPGFEIVSKLLGLAVTSPPNLAVSKLLALAATHPPSGVAVSKLLSLATTVPPAGESVSKLLGLVVVESALPCGPIPLFPTLPVGFPVKWKPTFKTTTGEASSGREVRWKNQPFALHEFELTFEVLRDQTQNQAAYGPLTGFIDYMKLCQFWLMMYGRFGLFYFNAPWDNSRANQAVGIGDGETIEFIVYRLFGIGNSSLNEPVGAVNVMTTVFINNTPISPTSYTTVGNLLIFNTAPLLGDTISATFSFYYLCHFMEDKQDFEEFLKNVWMVKALRFRSVYFPLI